MAKYKLARPGRKAPKARGMIPCLFLLISGMVLLSLLFWAVMRSGTS